MSFWTSSGPRSSSSGSFSRPAPTSCLRTLCRSSDIFRTTSRPVPFGQIEEVVESELGLTLERAFATFEERPVRCGLDRSGASRAAAQRRLGGGEGTASPRPHAKSRPISSCSTRLPGSCGERVKVLRFIDTVGLVDEFARSIRGELDYRREAANAERFGRNFGSDPQVSIPACIPAVLAEPRTDPRVAGRHRTRPPRPG